MPLGALQWQIFVENEIGIAPKIDLAFDAFDFVTVVCKQQRSVSDRVPPDIVEMVENI